MPNQRDTDQIPTIALDQDDRDAFQRKRQKGSSNRGTQQHTPPPASGSSGAGWGIFALLIALAAIGGCYWLYEMNQQQQSALEKAQSRITELERTLSATGEEMGESTVALKVNVTKLAERTDQLWEQMDKLWASAWRKNQSQLKALATKSENQYKDGRKLQQGIQTTLNQTQTSLELLREQLEMQQQNSKQLGDHLDEAIQQLAALQKGGNANKKQIANLQEELANASRKNRGLTNRLAKLEKWYKAENAGPP